MKIDYPARRTSYDLSPDNDMNDLRMSAKGRPLYEHVCKFIAETVEPASIEYFRLAETKTDRWGFAPGQLDVLEKAKDKAKAEGLWNFFLPDAHTGEGLSNLDYAYIAAELGKNPLASESMNCAAPDTGTNTARWSAGRGSGSSGVRVEGCFKVRTLHLLIPAGGGRHIHPISRRPPTGSDCSRRSRDSQSPACSDRHRPGWYQSPPCCSCRCR